MKYDFDVGEKAAIRQRILEFVENNLPRLIPVPVPCSVKGASWFRKSGIIESVKVFAFPGFQLGVFSGKLMPALKLWLEFEEAGRFQGHPIVAGATSGNWGKDSALLSQMFSVKSFVAVVNSNTPRGKLLHLQAAGAKITIAPPGIPATEYVYEIAKKPGVVLLDQYVQDGSIQGHRWTMRHVDREMKRLRQNGDLLGSGYNFGAVTGTCSTIMAAHRYLKPITKSKYIKVFAVASMSREEKVPGSRSPEELDELEPIGGFPYKTALDFELVRDITRRKAYEMNAERLQQSLLPVGPTSALLEAGFYHLLRCKVEADRVCELMNEEGEIAVVLMWVDSYLAYLDDPEYLSFFSR